MSRTLPGLDPQYHRATPRENESLIRGVALDMGSLVGLGEEIPKETGWVLEMEEISEYRREELSERPGRGGQVVSNKRKCVLGVCVV